jgi:hypothetical protein
MKVDSGNVAKDSGRISNQITAGVTYRSQTVPTVKMAKFSRGKCSKCFAHKLAATQKAITHSSHCAIEIITRELQLPETGLPNFTLNIGLNEIVMHIYR